VIQYLYLFLTSIVRRQMVVKRILLSSFLVMILSLMACGDGAPVEEDQETQAPQVEEDQGTPALPPECPPIDIPRIPLYEPLSLDTAGNIVHIPGEYTAIQEGIDAAADGDAVLVAPGTYYENIDFRGKGITITSEAGPDDTIIDGGRVTSVVTFWSGEGTNSILYGFTITNGLVEASLPFGGGISIRDASPTISHCKITKNGSEGSAGGIYVGGNQALPVIENNLISSNVAPCRGGGITVRDGACPTIRDNIIIDNLATGGSGIEVTNGASPVIEGNTISNNLGSGCDGGRVKQYLMEGTVIDDRLCFPGIPGGVLVAYNCSPIIRSNVITGNSGGGMGIMLGSAPTIENNIISRNVGQIAGGILVAFNSTPVVTNNTIEFNQGPAIWIDKTSSILDEQRSPVSLEASTVIQDTNEAFTFSGHWNSFSGKGYSGGTCMASARTGATAQIRFYGTLISLTYLAEPGSGIAEIDIDGIVYPSIDMYAPLRISRSEKLIALGLAQSEHVLTVTISGDRNPLSSEPSIVVDAVSVGGGLSAGQNQIIGSIVSWPPSSPEHEGPSSDRVLLVPSGYSTIQGAIEAANNGDTIIVAPGTYRENLDLLGKRITLRSQNPDDVETVESTILEAKESLSTVTIVRGETRETTLAGFTIRNGLGERGIYISSSSPTIAQNIISDCIGGGIVCNEADSPLITGNTIKNNNIADQGGGIKLYLSSPVIIGNVITDNEAYLGGGIFAWFSSPTIVNNTITNNRSIFGGAGTHNEQYCQVIIRGNSFSGNTSGSAGAIYLAFSSGATVDGNIIMENQGAHGGGVKMGFDCYPQITNNVIAMNKGGGIHISASHPEMTNNTIVDNIKDDGGESLGVVAMWNSKVFITTTILLNSEIHVYDEYSEVIVTYSLVKDGPDASWPGEGNISQDPLFVGDGDYHLLPSSPCIDAGTDVDVSMDIEGNERPQGQGFDIGAYEYVTQD